MQRWSELVHLDLDILAGYLIDYFFITKLPRMFALQVARI